MASFIDEFVSNFGSNMTKDLSKTTGVDQGILGEIIPKVAPMILGGLKKQKDERGGSDRVDHILNKYGNAGVLDDLQGLFSQKSKESRPDPNLGGLLGNSGTQAVQQMTEKYGISTDIAAKLIPMIAPVVLGALSKKRDQEKAGSSGIASLLDQDGDGSILDDVAGFLTGSGGGKKGGGLLGGLVGSIFGKKS